MRHRPVEVSAAKHSFIVSPKKVFAHSGFFCLKIEAPPSATEFLPSVEMTIVTFEPSFPVAKLPLHKRRELPPAETGR
jgi:hypothetical protein